VLHQAIFQLPKAIPIPITPSGGTKEAAIATPASQAAIFLYHNARNATSPDAKAIPKSTKVGSVLEEISLVTVVSGITEVISHAIHIPPNILTNNSHKELPKSFLLPVAIAKATPWMGLIIGAISIAHITTGVALIKSPSVAITTDSHI